MSLLIVSAVIGSSTPVLAGKGYKDSDLEKYMNDPVPLAKSTLMAINKVYGKDYKKEDKKFFHFKKTDKYEVKYVHHDIHGEGLGELCAILSKFKVNADNSVEFYFDISEGYFGGNGTVTVSEEALTEAGKVFFKASFLQII
jgi:hypothetical protein